MRATRGGRRGPAARAPDLRAPSLSTGPLPRAPQAVSRSTRGGAAQRTAGAPLLEVGGDGGRVHLARLRGA